MTCIIAYKDKDKIYMAGDSAGVGGGKTVVRKDEKVFINGEMIFGFTSSFRMGQILRYNFTVPKQEDESDMKYLVATFIDEVTKCFRENNFGEEEKSVKDGGVFMIGYNGNIYTVYSDFQICKVEKDFNSVGCGEEYALGALTALESTSFSVPEKIELAMKAAEYYSTGVRGPFNIISL